MGLALSLALTACKGNSKKETKEESPKEDQVTPAWQKAPQIGDQCNYIYFPTRCEGNDIITCLNDTSSEDSVFITSTVKKEACEEGTKCIENNRELGYAYCADSAEIFDSCQAALADFWARYDADSDKERHTCETYVGNEFDGLYMAPECFSAGDGKYILLEQSQYCSECTINIPETSFTCTPLDASFTGASAQEGDSCNYRTFVARRLDNSSALICDYDKKTDSNKVKKITCAAGLEVALWNSMAFCIDPKEAECGSQVFKCGTVKGHAASLLDKVCLCTDKGDRLIAVDSFFADKDINDNLILLSVICGAKGCDQATGTCLDAGPSDFKWCQAGQFGLDCEPCTCEHGQCDDGFKGDGECYSCDKDYYGKNCDKTYYGTMSDSKNHKYHTVLINNVEWMAENMATDTATDGSAVTCDANTEHSSDFVAKYGCLYSWEDAMKICPAGWHLPSKEEFEALLAYVGADNIGDLWAIEGYSSEDKYGFGILPAGYCNNNDTNRCYGFSFLASFWTSSITEIIRYYLNVDGNSAEVQRHGVYGGADYYLSVRCVKDK